VVMVGYLCTFLQFCLMLCRLAILDNLLLLLLNSRLETPPFADCMKKLLVPLLTRARFDTFTAPRAIAAVIAGPLRGKRRADWRARAGRNIFTKTEEELDGTHTDA